MFHVGVNEFKFVGLLHDEYRVEQLLGHMCSIISGNAPDYLRAKIDMVCNVYRPIPILLYIYRFCLVSHWK